MAVADIFISPPRAEMRQHSLNYRLENEINVMHHDAKCLNHSEGEASATCHAIIYDITSR